MGLLPAPISPIISTLERELYEKSLALLAKIKRPNTSLCICPVHIHIIKASLIACAVGYDINKSFHVPLVAGDFLCGTSIAFIITCFKAFVSGRICMKS